MSATALLFGCGSRNEEARGSLDSKFETPAFSIEKSQRVFGSPSFNFAASTNGEIIGRYDYAFEYSGHSGPAIGVGDFDSDGDLDFVVANGGKLTFYENKTPQHNAGNK